MDNKEIIEIIEKSNHAKGGIISILEEVQSGSGYLSEHALRFIAEKTHRSLVDIYGIATFYKSFRLQPVGKHSISVCLGTACHVRGARAIVEEFERQLRIPAGATTDDMEFTLNTVNCLGACALGPIVLADGTYFSNVTPSQVKDILKKTKKGIDYSGIKTDKRYFQVNVTCPHCNESLMDRDQHLDGYPSIKMMTSIDNKNFSHWVSGLYGSPTYESEYTVPKDTLLHYFCPRCKKELNDSFTCSTCEADMLYMNVQNGGILYLCSRTGCSNHLLDINKDDHMATFTKKLKNQR
ncbi:MAG: NAD(P)H-dependent oxidoreductase subunit E [Spirochaetales bacterium]|nr:NAD(P)H-dependent oxidoreductase subunit E [Spirochaetales bacterium]